jgi:hypothetical protein
MFKNELLIFFHIYTIILYRLTILTILIINVTYHIYNKT